MALPISSLGRPRGGSVASACSRASRRSSGIGRSSLRTFEIQWEKQEISEAFGLAAEPPLPPQRRAQLATDRINSALLFLGICLQPSALREVVQKADPLGTGFVTGPTFEAVALPLLGARTTVSMRRASMLEAFRAVDAEGEGWVGTEAFRRGAAACDHSEEQREELMRCVLAIAREGRVYYNEFVDRYAPACEGAGGSSAAAAVSSAALAAEPAARTGPLAASAASTAQLEWTQPRVSTCVSVEAPPLAAAPPDAAAAGVGDGAAAEAAVADPAPDAAAAAVDAALAEQAADVGGGGGGGASADDPNAPVGESEADAEKPTVG